MYAIPAAETAAEKISVRKAAISDKYGSISNELLY